MIPCEINSEFMERYYSFSYSVCEMRLSKGIKTPFLAVLENPQLENDLSSGGRIKCACVGASVWVRLYDRRRCRGPGNINVSRKDLWTNSVPRGTGAPFVRTPNEVPVQTTITNPSLVKEQLFVLHIT